MIEGVGPGPDGDNGRRKSLPLHSSPKQPRRVPAILVLLLSLVLVAVLYGRTLGFPFLFDDLSDIVGNESIRSLWPPTWLSKHGRPLVNLSFALNYAFDGLAVEGYHLINIALHVVAAVLAFLVVRRALNDQRIALFAAVVWLVHPLHTTVVTYTVHRYESVVAVALLGALYFFQKFLDREKGKRLVFAGAALGCGLAAFASKEISVALPFLLLAYDRCFESGSLKNAFRARPGFHATSFASLGFLYALVRAAPKNTSQGLAFVDLSPLDYARSELGVLPHYLRLVFFPDALSFDYFDWPVARSLGDVAPGALLLGGLAIGGLVAWYKAPRLGFVFLVWLLILGPTSSFLPLHGELVAERRLYLPLLALIVGLFAVAEGQLTNPGRKNAFLALIVGVTLALGARTWVRNEDFSSVERAYLSVLDVRPHNARARYHLALELVAQGRTAEALREFLRAAEDEPNFANAEANAGVLFAQRGALSDAEAHFLRAVRLAPENVIFRLNLVECRVAQKKWKAALTTLARGLARSPGNRDLELRLRRVEALARDSCPSSLGPEKNPDCP